MRDGIPTTERGGGQLELEQIRRKLSAKDLMGSPLPEDALDPDAPWADPPSESHFDWGEAYRSAELFQGLVVEELGYETPYIALTHEPHCEARIIRDSSGNVVETKRCNCKPTRRRAGWIAEDRLWKTVGRNSSEEHRAKRPARIRSLLVERRSLSILEEMDRREADRHVREMRKTQNTKKRDATICEEETLTAAELERTFERVIQRENEKLRGDIIDAIAAATRFDPVAEAEAYTEDS